MSVKKIAKGKNTYIFDKKSFLYSALVFLAFIAVGFFVCLSTDAFNYFTADNLFFTVMFSFLFCTLIFILPRKASAVVFGVLYAFFLIYGISQHIYFRLFNKVISFSTLANTQEGAGYLGSSILACGIWQAIVFFILLGFGVYLFFHIKYIVRMSVLTRVFAFPLMIALVCGAQFTLPRVLGEKSQTAWDSFDNNRYVYENYTDPHKCMGMVGYYQFLCVDFYNCAIKPLFADKMTMNAEIENFFEQYPNNHTDNGMTGVYAGKNVIIVMMESMDYQAISEDNTPNIYKMMNSGINFENYYSAIYGDGATFSNEFVLNTGIYAPITGTSSFSYINNKFAQSLPNLFRNKGYSANSYHKNYGWFYNRALMHSAFGYQKYNSFFDYIGNTDLSEKDLEDAVNIDTFLTETPSLCDELLHKGDDTPFMDFVITYSGHLPYTEDDYLTQYAYDKYVHPDEVLSEYDDLASLRAKARITDDMLGQLMEKIDDDTVLICMADHYCYGLDDETLNATMDTEWALRQHTPCFVYCKAQDAPKKTVTKLCSNADFLPTIANLFGLDVPDNLIGHDIFDEDYSGYVIFSNYSWLNFDVYYHDGVVREYGDYTEEENEKMSEYMYRMLSTYENLLNADYYGK